MDAGKPSIAETLAQQQRLDSTAASSPAAPEYDYWFKVASLVEAKLHYEAGWTAHRMMWLVVSQSFLFSAFATTVQNGRPAFGWGAPESWLVWVLPLLGLAHSTAASVSMRSSRKVDHAILVGRGRIEERLRHWPGLEHVPLLGYDNRTGPLRRTIMTGSMASRVIPVTLVLAWAVVLASLVIGTIWPVKSNPSRPVGRHRQVEPSIPASSLHPQPPPRTSETAPLDRAVHAHAPAATMAAP